jgi:hypothetical protein
MAASHGGGGGGGPVCRQKFFKVLIPGSPFTSTLVRTTMIVTKHPLDMIDLQNRLLLCIIDCRACRPSSRRAWTSRRASPWPRCGTPRGGRGTWTSNGTGMGPASWAGGGAASSPARIEDGRP